MMDYTLLVTSSHRAAPMYTAWVSALTQHSSDVQGLLSSLVEATNLETAEGVQLDAVGAWIGVSRRVQIPAGEFFSFDVPGLGWDEAEWKGPYEAAYTEVSMDDDVYRAALRLKVLCNTYKGTLGEIDGREVLLVGETPNVLYVKDHQDMTVSVEVEGPEVPLHLRYAIENSDLIPRPMGVRVLSYTYTIS